MNIDAYSMVYTREKAYEFVDVSDDLIFYIPDDDCYCIKLEEDNHVLEDGDVVVFVENDILLSAFLIRRQDIAELLT